MASSARTTPTPYSALELFATQAGTKSYLIVELPEPDLRINRLAHLRTLIMRSNYTGWQEVVAAFCR